MDFSRVHDDIAAGRLWKACDRLHGMRAHAPADQEVLELLGCVSADMRDLPTAGLAWFLTDGTDPRRDEALAAMHQRYRGPHALAAALRVRTGIEEFPPPVAERLRELKAQVPWWEPGPRPRRVPRKPASNAGGIAVAAGCLVLLALFLVPWIRGVASFF